MNDKRLIIDDTLPLELYKMLKYRMLDVGIYPADPEMIEGGIQFRFYSGDDSEVLRIEDLGGGSSLVDLSLIRDPQVEYILRRLLPTATAGYKTGAFDSLYVKYDLSEDDCIYGLSEAGRIDYFGPLVVSGVATCRGGIDELFDMKLKEPQFYDEETLDSLAEKIRKSFPTTSVILSPELYNEMYIRHKDIDLIMLKAHVKVLNKAQEKEEISVAIMDRFSESDFSTEIFGEHGMKIIHPSAKRKHPVVLAAGIVSRSIYQREVVKIGAEYRITLPRGTGDEVVAAAKSFIKSYGLENLFKVGKVNFKLTGQLI